VVYISYEFINRVRIQLMTDIKLNQNLKSRLIMTNLNYDLFIVLIAFLFIFVACNNETSDNETDTIEHVNDAQVSDDEQIAFAESAAPVDISSRATILDKEGDLLREGTNKWTCIAMPGEPMCLDEPWMSWVDAYMNQADEVNIETVGIAYMLQGDQGTSNIRPFVEEPTDDNEWVTTGPHLMLIVPDPALLEGIPTDPMSGGPYVMWAGTPFEHVMIPIYPGTVEMPYRED